MGKFLNPGTCVAQEYIYRFPRNPVPATTKIVASKVGAIGMLRNGIPIYGLSNANSWNGSSNSNMGNRVWWVEVYKSEGKVLDTAFGAHPQQQGAYHTHATPLRLYKDVPTSQHSPLIGYAFDGYPVYGPYGYSQPMNSNSSVARMKTGYSLRNISTRTTLPDGSTASQTGPAVSTTYPLGTYCEDYEWLASNNGDLDAYNGRNCVTPEYPGGTYAYFVTIDANGTPQYPYIIGPYFYGQPDMKNMPQGPVPTGISFPTNPLNCLNPITTAVNDLPLQKGLLLYPNPGNGRFEVMVDPDRYHQYAIYDSNGRIVKTGFFRRDDRNIIELNQKGIYFLRAWNEQTAQSMTERIVVNE
jgi:hypothetical protein